MYKLLIVDDEYNIRNGLLNGIPWHEIGVEVVATAVDGDDAYEKVVQLSPDIVLTDVNMDNMNGLDLADLLKHHHPTIKVVILSGYDDFEYVSRALELKVFTYIIKPVHSDELIKTMQKLITEIEDERRLKDKIRFMELEIDKSNSLLAEKFLYDLINGNIENNQELELRAGFLDMKFGSTDYTCMLIEISDYSEIIRNSGIRLLQSQLFGVRAILCDELGTYELWPLIGGNRSFTLIIGSSCGFSECFEKLEKIVSDINVLLNISISISIGGITGNIINIAKSYKEALTAQEYNAISTKASIISIHDVQSSNGPQYFNPIDTESLIHGILNNPHEDALNKNLNDLFDTIAHQVYSKDQLRIGIMGLLSTIAMKAMEMGVDVYQIYTRDLIDPYSVMERYSSRDQIQNWLRNIILNVRREIKSKQNANVNSVIVKAKTFMNQHYTNPYLSLTEVAAHVYLNASYFSRLYKNETGESFIETLTRIRLEKATNLLKDSNEKIAAIAENIGYPNTRYFNSVFKKHYGLTPLEYRKSI